MLSTQWQNAFAPVGCAKGDNLWVPAGAGVFLSKPPLIWLVTANHVVESVGAQEFGVLITRCSGGGMIEVKLGTILAMNGLDWARDRGNDLAAAPMPVSPEICFTALSENQCLRLGELMPSMPCFTFGCPYGLHVDAHRAIPLVLDGVISGVDQQTRRVFTSAPTFPGNSGGPLVAIRSPFIERGEGFVLKAGATVFLAGIMLRTVLVTPSTSEGQMPPLHLGMAAPMDAILDLLESEHAKAITARVA
jgi:hypothetical protein